jgi:hypothetical protein
MDKIVAFLESQILWGVIALVLAAIGFSGKFNMSISTVLLVCAWVISSIGAYRMIHVPRHVIRGVLTLSCAFVLAVCFYSLDRWLTPQINFCYFDIETTRNDPAGPYNSSWLVLETSKQ